MHIIEFCATYMVQWKVTIIRRRKLFCDLFHKLILYIHREHRNKECKQRWGHISSSNLFRTNYINISNRIWIWLRWHHGSFTIGTSQDEGKDTIKTRRCLDKIIVKSNTSHQKIIILGYDQLHWTSCWSGLEIHLNIWSNISHVLVVRSSSASLSNLALMISLYARLLRRQSYRIS